MVRGAQYDNGIPQSDNAIEAGETKAHGVNEGVCLMSNSILLLFHFHYLCDRENAHAS